MSLGSELRIVIAGGGTGGHLFPALAIGDRLQVREPALKIHYIGSKFGLEAATLPDYELPHTLLPIRGLQRGIDAISIGQNLLFPGRALKSYRLAKSIIKKLQPAVVVGTGGYASGLPLLAAVKKGIPTLIQEQNSYPGMTTRKLAPKVDCVCLAFAEAGQYLKSNNIIVTGNPVRTGIDQGQVAKGAEIFNLNPDKLTLFLFGGSQGSAALNKIMASIAGQLAESDIQILWQTGWKQFDPYRQFDSQRIRVLPFIEHMDHAYALSHLILSRAGALTLAEITICGKPAILVPLPTAAADHQTWNARSMEKSGAARLITEQMLSPEVLFEQISVMLKDADLLQDMSEKSLQLAQPEATNTIVTKILELAQA